MSTHWAEAPWLGFDTETTGVNPRKDHLVTAALVLRTPGNDADSITTWLADPEVTIPANATSIHGITTEYARKNGDPLHTVLEEVATRITEHWSQGYPIVAFNASFDLTLLDTELKTHFLPSLRERMGGNIGLVLDPLVLDRAVDRFRKGKRTLTVMAPHYGISAREDAHQAQADVAMTLDVLRAISQKYGELTRMNNEEIFAFQEKSHHDWATSFEQWLHSQGRSSSISKIWPLK